MKREGECVRCGGCCRTLRITGVLGNIVSQHGSLEEARTYYSFRGITISDVNHEAGTVCFELDIPCDKLGEDNTCSLHGSPEKKPLICHRYPWFPDDIDGCGFTWRRG